MSDITECKKDMELIAKRKEAKDLADRLPEDRELNDSERDEYIHKAYIQMLGEEKYSRSTIFQVAESLMHSPHKFFN